MVAEGEGVEGADEIGEGNYEVQTSNYKIKKSRECKVHIGIKILKINTDYA